MIWVFFTCHDCMCGTKYQNNYNNSEFREKVKFHKPEMPQTFSLTSTKPLRKVTITEITLGCPFNPVNDYEYSRKYLRKLIQVRNSIWLTQRLLIKTAFRIYFDLFRLKKLIKIMFTTTILARESFKIFSFRIRSLCDSRAIETGSNSHGTVTLTIG